MLRRVVLAALVASSAGCTPTRVAHVASTPEALLSCDPLWIDLSRRNFEATERSFDARLHAALPAAALASAWDRGTAGLGELKSCFEMAHDEPNGHDRRRLRLIFDRGSLPALIARDKGKLVIGIFFGKPERTLRPADARSNTLDERTGVTSRPFSVGDLAGELTSPPDLPSKGAPAIVLVAGSGPMDRDETVGAHQPFRDLAYGLSARGIVVLRYDKRSVAHPEQLMSAGTTVDQEVIADAARAVMLLKRSEGVDANRVFVLGHSLGALLAPEIAARASPISGVVLVAPPGRPLPVLILDQLRAFHAPEGTIADAQRQVDLFLTKQLRPEETLFGMPARYWMDLDRRDEIGIARSLHVPLLFLRGEADLHVTATDLEIWKRGLSGVDDVRFTTFAGLDHLLSSSSTGSTRVAPALIEAIAAFVRSR